MKCIQSNLIHISKPIDIVTPSWEQSLSLETYYHWKDQTFKLKVIRSITYPLKTFSTLYYESKVFHKNETNSDIIKPLEKLGYYVFYKSIDIFHKHMNILQFLFQKRNDCICILFSKKINASIIREHIIPYL